jgi:uncharacterized protein YjbJ (UPF0337 family)
MSGRASIIKGRIEEAAGVLIGNDKLRRKGKLDQAGGMVEQAAGKFAEMDGRADIAKGRLEEAAGVLTGNSKLRRRGKLDQAIGQAKETSRYFADKGDKIARDRA